MSELIFPTYIIALIALMIAIYAAIEIHDMKKTQKRKQVQKRLHQIVQPTKSTKTKSHWG